MTAFNRGNTRAAKLTAEQVLEIRDKYLNHGYSQARLCREFQVSINTIGRIVREETWQTVAKPIEPVDHDGIVQRLAELQRRLNEDAARIPEAVEAARDKRLADELDTFKGDSK